MRSISPTPAPSMTPEEDAEWCYRAERFSSLVDHQRKALQGVQAALPDCASMDWEAYTEADFERALACAVVDLVGKPRDPDAAWCEQHPDLTELDHLMQYDEAAVERFIEDVRQALDPRRHFQLYR